MADWVDTFGDALVAAARREDAAAPHAAANMNAAARPGGPAAELPSLDLFGERLVAQMRVRDRRRRGWRRVVALLSVALPVAATSGVATAVVLKQTVIRAPKAPLEQTPLAGTARVSELRAKDPGGGLPWTVRVARGKTGFTCTTVGQVRDGVFGLTGLDEVFRRLPGDLSDACGQGGTLTGARVLTADRHADVRTIVYGVAGDGLRTATLTTARGNTRLAVGAGGTFVAALRGYPEDSAAGVALAFADGRGERHDFGAAKTTSLDPADGGAWEIERYEMGTRWRCGLIRAARSGTPERAQSPTACLGLRTSTRAWVADARTFRAGQAGVEGFDRWQWLDQPARTLVWGVGRTDRTIRSVTLLGAGKPREATLSKQGAFALLLPATVDPAKLTLEVHLADGRVQRERPGRGLTPDPVKSRRPR